MAFDRRGVLAAGGAMLGTMALRPAIATRGAGGPTKSFRPGEPWNDTDGKPIHAHGGSMMKVGKTFYWYGENKEHTTGLDGVWTWGVRCYASADLYSWKDLGLIIPPDLADTTSPLHPAKGIDRPHIIYNEMTKTFVCWLKIMDFKDGSRTRTVLTAPAITGPWKIVRSNLHLLGMKAGDFDLVVSPFDGKAYTYFERMHSEIICADLSDDYTDITGFYSTHLTRPAAPFVREGPAWFSRRGKQYLATSGITGYFPNPSEIAVADTFHGPWTNLGLLHRGDTEATSFDSQISCIFKHPDKHDLYIAMADRWTAGVPRDKWRAAKAFYDKLALPDRPKATAEELAGYQAVNMNHLATSEARYVWLPVRFENDRPVIEWHDEWTVEQFT